MTMMIALLPQMIRWPQDSASVLLALATQAQRNPVPSWLPADSKTLYQQGLEALTREDALHNSNHTGFQPIAHMLSTTSPKNIYQFFNGESAGLTFSSFDSPLVGSVLSRCWCFTLRCLFFLGLAVLADASAAFAIVSHPNRIQINYFTAQSA